MKQKNVHGSQKKPTNPDFKATAGLRLISEPAAEAIVAAVRAELLASSFRTSADLIGILSGVDEGVFGWLTLNFLLNRLPAAQLSLSG